jgi:hypothetical protein
MAASDAANEARLAAAAKATAAKTTAKPLTQAEIDAITARQVAAGGKSTDPANRLPGETATQANARITQGYKDQSKPELTKEGVAANATIEFVRQGAGGVGKYQEVYGVTTPIPTERTTTSGNTYDAQGNLISGTGLKTATATANNGATVYGVSEASKSPIATIREGGSSAGKDSTGKDIYYKTEGGTDVGFYYADGSKVPVDNLINVRQTVDFANAGWSIQGLPKGQTPAEIKYADLIKAEMGKGAQPGGNAYVRGDVVVVNDFNGVSLYNKQGQLISGKGSQYQIGIGGIDGSKINIAAVGVFGSPEYNLGNTVNISTSTSTSVPTSTSTETAATAALQKQIDDLKAAGLTAEAKRLEDKARFDAEIKTQAAASKLAYDTAAQDKADAIKVERVSAFETLKAEFEKYGLGSLVEDVKALVLNGTPKSQATLKLRATPEYKLRFAGNTQRLAEGKNLYDEGTYLALENDFRASFEAYGQKALLGNTRESAQSMFADFIGGDKSPTEIKDRIRLAVEEVSNRKDIRSEFQKFFPEITDSDLVSYFLKPKETLSGLTAKVRVAQIGSAASAQGLNANLTTATDLEQLGLTEQQARTGYQRVATDLPTIEKLGDIDKTDIGQTTAENAYLKGLASEQRKIDQAAQRERSRFAQSSGMNKVSLTDAKPAGQY